MTTRPSGASERAVAHHRRTHRLALVLVGLAALRAPAGLAANGVSRTITVRVYANADLPSLQVQRALAEADALLQAAHVEVRWRKCTGQNRPAACGASPGEFEMLLRVLKEGPVRKNQPDALGEALIAPCSGGGVLATVYLSHVARMAEATGTDLAVLLGRVAAHELGHLITQTPAHTASGLMRPIWTPDEVRRNRAADWAFMAADMVSMQTGPEPERCARRDSGQPRGTP